MKLFCISGANSFIGQHIVRRLFADGMDILPISHQELRDSARLKEILKHKPSIILHLSAFGNLISQQDEAEILNANVVDLFNLLSATKELPYKAFINFSSSSTLLPYETLYSATKGAGERLCKAFATKYQKNIISIQPYTVIGVGEHKEHLIPSLIRSCINGEKMPFVGTPVHDFIGVEDFVDAVKLVIENCYIKGEIQIGTGVATSNEEVLRLVEEITNKKANITRVGEMRNYDTNSWKANMIGIKTLGWMQNQNLREVIKGMVDEYISMGRV